MGLTAEAAKTELLEKVLALAESRLPQHKAAPAKLFIRHFYRDVSPNDLVHRDPEDLYGAALGLWSFGQTRLAGKPKLRAYTPRFEEHGWHSTHTVIEIVNDDMPFLVDSVTAELTRRNLGVHLVIHPVFKVVRDEAGKAIDFPALEGTPADAPSESHMHLEIDEQGSDALADIEAGILAVLADVRAAVQDWSKMRARMAELTASIRDNPPKGIAPEDAAEAADFLGWLYDDRFTFLGYRRADFDGDSKRLKISIAPDSGLGILRDPERSIFEGLRRGTHLAPDVARFLTAPEPVRLTKANDRSTIHRRVHMDTVAVKIFDENGKVTGEHLFAGLLTSVAYNQSPREIPLLRRKVAQVADRIGFASSGHAGKALMHVLETYPRDELFQIDIDRLTDIARGIVALQERNKVALFLRRDPFGRHITALVYVPRDRFTTSLRNQFEDILGRSLGGSVVAHYTYMGDDVLGRVLFIVKTDPANPAEFEEAEVGTRLAEAARTWADRLRQALVEAKGEETGLRLFRSYQNAFPAAYADRFTVQTAIFDIDRMEMTRGKAGAIEVNLYHPIEADDSELRFKVYHAGGPIVLSAVMPMMENMGLKVLEEVPFEVTIPDRDGLGHDRMVIHDFGMVTGDGAAVDFAEVRAVFHDAFQKVWSGEVENDGFNRLVLRAGLGWRSVSVLRAYCKYLRQASIPFSQDYMEDTLARNAEIARAIVRLFDVRFDPDLAKDRAEHEAGILSEIDHRLDKVDNLDEDRIIRRFVNLVRATVRTNYHQRDAEGGLMPFLSFKFDAKAIEELPQPAPLREIFVYSPRFEAVHLRFGFVARGGLRWSDRREDFRTEVLGLVKAQQVKNAVIVPVGSKGGFVLKKAPPPSEREAWLAEGVACYKLFIGAMLDITDNLDANGVIPPKDVVRHDGDDPYLVVAADKGTATFSDYANGVAKDHGFWLGDAFASGGSAGYDHKKMGITARGAWESVKRHFREFGHNTQTQDFTVVGVGDMSGDVFGNGMLLSPHIKLIGAFNHMHIFIDPDPDPAKSLAERQRLFDLPRSSWADYDAKLISKGGGIFDRKAKSIALTPEMQRLFGLSGTSATPSALIKAMLQSPVDLLWFGGIGTYVKAEQESHADAGDRANDSVRVNGSDLRCKVIGEGANLGMTHLGRIEFAKKGGRLNTDAIDNSAGVDCSDHEVNVKILLGSVVSTGDMTEKQRNALLAEMTEEIGQLVLRDNYQQTQAISVIESHAAQDLDRHQRLIRAMERAGDLNRKLEFLPDDEEIAERLAAKRGLTRPEIAVIFAYAKNITYRDLLDSDLPDDPQLAEDLVRYFPRPLQERFPKALKEHRLRREIVATSVTNSMINRAGPAFINEMRHRTGNPAPEIARAYTITREVFGLRAIWSAVEALDDQAPAAAQIQMLVETGRTIERMTEWFLRNESHPLDITQSIETYRSCVLTLADNLEGVLDAEQLESVRARARRFSSDGVPDELAFKIGQLKALSSGCDIVRLGAVAGTAVLDTARIYFGVGGRFGLDWLRSAANRIPSDNQWHRMALSAIIDDLWGLQSALTAQVLAGHGSGEDALPAWVGTRTDAVERVDALLAELRQMPQLDLAMLAVVNRELRHIVG